MNIVAQFPDLPDPGHLEWSLESGEPGAQGTPFPLHLGWGHLVIHTSAASGKFEACGLKDLGERGTVSSGDSVSPTQLAANGVFLHPGLWKTWWSAACPLLSHCLPTASVGCHTGYLVLQGKIQDCMSHPRPLLPLSHLHLPRDLVREEQ